MTNHAQHIRLKTVLSALLLAAACAVPQARAQEAAPPEAQLIAPGSAMPAQPAAPQNAPVAAPSGERGGPSVAMGGDPCPASDTLSAAPDDLAKVQEEIDRFTLCVQRAQLLERLNESALKNRQAADLALGYTPPMLPGAMPGMAGPQMGSMPPGLAALPAAALAGADVSPMQAAAPAAATPTAAPAVIETPEPEVKAWTIREVYGSGEDMQARLLSPDGDEVKVRSGQKLPDGKTVARITPAGVSLRDGKTTLTLEWARS